MTREPFVNRGRITDPITAGTLFKDVGLPPLYIASGRLMLCGSAAMLSDLRALPMERAFVEGTAASRDTPRT